MFSDFRVFGKGQFVLQTAVLLTLVLFLLGQTPGVAIANRTVATTEVVDGAVPEGLTAVEWQSIREMIRQDVNGINSWQQEKLVAADGAADDWFGYSVAIDGETAVIGANHDDDNGNDSGSAYVFIRSNGSWSQQAKLVPADGAASDSFGISVAIDGETAVIGAHYDDDQGSDSGAAYVFVRSGDSWSQQAKLGATDGAASVFFGASVAIDEDTAVIGAVGDADQGMYSGSAYVFVRSGGSWSQQAKLAAADGASADYFGDTVVVDGETAVIGAYGDDDQGNDAGAAYVFVRNGVNWSQQAKLVAADGAASDYFGRSLAVDGETAVIGAQGDDDKGFSSGSVYVFVRSGNSWSQQAKLVATDGATADLFGHSVAVDGETAIIGAYYDDDKGSNSGSAYVFVRSGNSWSQQAKLMAADGAANDCFGRSVAISGETAIIGAYYDDDKGSNSGSAYVFTMLPDNSISIAADDADKAEGDSDNTPFTFTVIRSGDTSGASSVEYTITGSGTNQADATDFGGTLPQGTINFSANDTSQIITVNVIGDAVAEPDEGFTITLSNPSGSTIAIETANGIIQNDDTVGVTLTESDGCTNVTEGGATDSYSVVLSSEPTADVMVTVDPDDQIDLGNGTDNVIELTFTDANWDTPQMITVTAVDDFNLENDHIGIISVAVSSSDNAYDGMSVADINVHIDDNEVAIFLPIVMND